MLVPKTCIMSHVHLGSICDENESGRHIDVCFLRSGGERDRKSELDRDHIRMPKGPRCCWPIHAKWLLRRAFSTHPTAERASATSKPYVSSLRLPKTRFPLWSEPNEREVPFRERTTTELYRWQVCGFRQLCAFEFWKSSPVRE